MNKESIVREINKLRREKRVVILAHYYVEPEVQDIADYIGDSFGLSQMAAQTDSPTILFCGVRFMAETASIISPEKKVLIPDTTTGCSLAESIDVDDIVKWREKNRDGVVVAYVNTTAEVKAHTDICCTSANAMQVINSIPKDKKIFFVPDKNLARYIKMKTGREIEIWQGDCCVHEYYSSPLVMEEIERNPGAEILIHPESSCSHDPSIYSLPDTFVLSTTGMVRRVGLSDAHKFIVVTEPGVIHQMKLMYPRKEFISVDPYNKCLQMRKITLEGVLEALTLERHEIKVPEEIREKAFPSIRRMLEIS